MPLTRPSATFIPHTFRIRITGAEAVSLVGDFNNWHTAAHPLVQLPTGEWERIVDLPPGKHRYAFFVLARDSAGVTFSRVAGNGSVVWVPEDGSVSVTAHPAQAVRIPTAA